MVDRDTIEERVGNDSGDTDLAPAVDVPEPPAIGDEVDTDPDLVRLFWRLVVVFNLALLAGSLGVMFLVFEGLTTTGGGLLGVGGLAGGYGLVRYWLFQQEH